MAPFKEKNVSLCRKTRKSKHLMLFFTKLSAQNEYKRMVT